MVETTETDAPETTEALGTLPYLTRVPGGIPDTESTLREAVEVTTGDGLMLRVTPELYFVTRGKLKHTWVRWSGVRWQVVLTEAQARELVADLGVFFQEWVRRKQGEQEGR